MKIESSPKTLNIEQPEKFEYRPAWQVGISTSLKTLSIEQLENFEYRAAWKVWASTSLKTLSIEQPAKFEYRAAWKVWISNGPKWNIEQPEKFEYRAARKVWISSNRAAVLQNQLLRETAFHETPAENSKSSKSILALSSPSVLYGCYLSLANQPGHNIKLRGVGGSSGSF